MVIYGSEAWTLNARDEVMGKKTVWKNEEWWIRTNSEPERLHGESRNLEVGCNGQDTCREW